MTLQIIDVKLGTACYRLLEEINENSFPDHERIPLNEFYPLIEQELVELKCLTKGTDVIGFYILIPDDKIRFLAFFAIGPQWRSRGYGSETLRLLSHDENGRALTLCIEPIDKGAENNSQRLRRRIFYLNNGFYATGHKQFIQGNCYEVLCNSENFDSEAFNKLMEAMEDHDE